MKRNILSIAAILLAAAVPVAARGAVSTDPKKPLAVWCGDFPTSGTSTRGGYTLDLNGNTSDGKAITIAAGGSENSSARGVKVASTTATSTSTAERWLVAALSSVPSTGTATLAATYGTGSGVGHMAVDSGTVKFLDTSHTATGTNSSQTWDDSTSRLFFAYSTTPAGYIAPAAASAAWSLPAEQSTSLDAGDLYGFYVGGCGDTADYQAAGAQVKYLAILSRTAGSTTESLAQTNCKYWTLRNMTSVETHTDGGTIIGGDNTGLTLNGGVYTISGTKKAAAIFVQADTTLVFEQGAKLETTASGYKKEVSYVETDIFGPLYVADGVTLTIAQEEMDTSTAQWSDFITAQDFTKNSATSTSAVTLTATIPASPIHTYSGTDTALKPVAVWNGDFPTSDTATRGGFTLNLKGNTSDGAAITLGDESTSSQGGVYVRYDSSLSPAPGYSNLVMVAAFDRGEASPKGKFLFSAHDHRNNSEETDLVGLKVKSNGEFIGTWTQSENGTTSNIGNATYTEDSSIHYVAFGHAMSNTQGNGGIAYFDSTLVVTNSSLANGYNDAAAIGMAIGGTNANAKANFAGAKIKYVAVFAGASNTFPAETASAVKAFSPTAMTSAVSGFSVATASTGVNLSTAGAVETISGAVSVPAVFVQEDATIKFSASGASLTVGGGTGPIYIAAGKTLTIDATDADAFVNARIYNLDQVRVKTAAATTPCAISEKGVFAGGSGYSRWWYADPTRVMTWQTPSSVTSDHFHNTNTKYAVFDITRGADTSTTYENGIGDSTTQAKWKYLAFTQKSGDDGFWQPPGTVLRFVQSDGYAKSDLIASFSPLAVAGLIVENGATGYSLKGGTDRTTLLGDPTGTNETWFVINEDFAINRQGWTYFTATSNVEVAEDKTFTIDADSFVYAKSPKANGTLSNAPTSGGELRLHGAGTFKVRSLAVTNAVLDYSALDVSRTTAFIDGTNVINAATTIKLPAGATFPYQLSTKINDATTHSEFCTFLVGGETVADKVYLGMENGKAATNVVSVSMSADTTWSSLTGSVTGAAAADVLLVKVSGGSTLTIDQATDLTYVQFDIAEDVTLKISSDSTYALTAGTIAVTGKGKMYFDSSNAGKVSAAFKGDGTVVYNGVLPASFNRLGWRGTLWLENNESVAGFTPSLYGNANSTIRMTKIKGNFTASDTFDGTLDLKDTLSDNASGGYALEINNGSSNQSQITIGKLDGNGTLKLNATPTHPFTFKSNANPFTGSIVSTSTNKLKVKFGTGDASAGNGQILVTGPVTSQLIEQGSTWNAADKIIVRGKLTNAGKVTGVMELDAAGGVFTNGVEVTSGGEDAAATHAGTVELSSLSVTGGKVVNKNTSAQSFTATGMTVGASAGGVEGAYYGGGSGTLTLNKAVTIGIGENEATFTGYGTLTLGTGVSQDDTGMTLSLLKLGSGSTYTTDTGKEGNVLIESVATTPTLNLKATAQQVDYAGYTPKVFGTATVSYTARSGETVTDGHITKSGYALLPYYRIWKASDGHNTLSDGECWESNSKQKPANDSNVAFCASGETTVNITDGATSYNDVQVYGEGDGTKTLKFAAASVEGDGTANTLAIKNLNVISGATLTLDGTSGVTVSGGTIYVEQGATLILDGWAPAVNVTGYGTVQLKGAIALTTSVTFDSTLTVTVSPETEATITTTDSNTVTIPTFTINGTATLSGATFASTTVKGSGVAIYDGKLPTVITGWTAAAWTGTVWIENCENTDSNSNNWSFKAVNPATYGNADSTVRLTKCKWYFSNGGTFNGTLDLTDTLSDGTDVGYALEISDGYSNATNNFNKLTGTGTLKLNKSATQLFWFKSNDAAFEGSISGQSGSTLRLKFGAGEDVVESGRIVIAANAAQKIAAGKTWSATSGVVVNGTLTVAGTLSGSTATAIGESGKVAVTGEGQTAALTPVEGSTIDVSGFTGTGAPIQGTLSAVDGTVFVLPATADLAKGYAIATSGTGYIENAKYTIGNGEQATDAKLVLVDGVLKTQADAVTISGVTFEWGADYKSLTVTADVAGTGSEQYTLTLGGGTPIEGTKSANDKVSFTVENITRSTAHDATAWKIEASVTGKVTPVASDSGSAYVADGAEWFVENSGTRQGGGWQAKDGESKVVTYTDGRVSPADGDSFVAVKESTGNIVVVHMEGVTFADINTDDELVVEGAKAAVKIYYADESDKTENAVLAFYVLTSTSPSVTWAKATWGDSAPTANGVYDVDITLNYDEKTYTVAVDGSRAQSNAVEGVDGSRLLSIADDGTTTTDIPMASTAAAKGVTFQGVGSLAGLSGEQYTGYMATDEKGNKYLTMEAALAVANATITLLHDTGDVTLSSGQTLIVNGKKTGTVSAPSEGEYTITRVPADDTQAATSYSVADKGTGYYWTGAKGDSLWTTPGNWTVGNGGAVATRAPRAGDTAVFSGVDAEVILPAGGVTIDQLTLQKKDTTTGEGDDATTTTAYPTVTLTAPEGASAESPATLTLAVTGASTAVPENCKLVVGQNVKVVKQNSYADVVGTLEIAAGGTFQTLAEGLALATAGGGTHNLIVNGTLDLTQGLTAPQDPNSTANITVGAAGTIKMTGTLEFARSSLENVTATLTFSGLSTTRTDYAIQANSVVVGCDKLTVNLPQTVDEGYVYQLMSWTTGPGEGKFVIDDVNKGTLQYSATGLVLGSAVAKIGEKKYGTLQAAIEEASPSDTIEIIADGLVGYTSKTIKTKYAKEGLNVTIHPLSAEWQVTTSVAGGVTTHEASERAATYTWSGAENDNNWASTNNWLVGSAVATRAPGGNTGDSVTFNKNATPTLAKSVSLGEFNVTDETVNEDPTVAVTLTKSEGAESDVSISCTGFVAVRKGATLTVGKGVTLERTNSDDTGVNPSGSWSTTTSTLVVEGTFKAGRNLYAAQDGNAVIIVNEGGVLEVPEELKLPADGSYTAKLIAKGTVTCKSISTTAGKSTVQLGVNGSVTVSTANATVADNGPGLAEGVSAVEYQVKTDSSQENKTVWSVEAKDAVFTWVGSENDSAWATAANWQVASRDGEDAVATLVPASRAPDTGDKVVFNSEATVTLGANRNVAGMQIGTNGNVCFSDASTYAVNTTTLTVADGATITYNTLPATAPIAGTSVATASSPSQVTVNVTFASTVTPATSTTYSLLAWTTAPSSDSVTFAIAQTAPTDILTKWCVVAGNTALTLKEATAYAETSTNTKQAYDTLQAAVTAAGENGSVTLLANDNTDVTLPAGASLTVPSDVTYSGTVTVSAEGYTKVESTDADGATVYTAVSTAAETWTGTGNDNKWTNPDNWSLGFVPTANTTVTINGGDSAENAVDIILETPYDSTGGSGTNDDKCQCAGIVMSGFVKLSNPENSYCRLRLYGDVELAKETDSESGETAAKTGTLILNRVGLNNQKSGDSTLVTIYPDLEIADTGDGDSWFVYGNFCVKGKTTVSGKFLVYASTTFDGDVTLSDSSDAKAQICWGSNAAVFNGNVTVGKDATITDDSGVSGTSTTFATGKTLTVNGKVELHNTVASLGTVSVAQGGSITVPGTPTYTLATGTVVDSAIESGLKLINVNDAVATVQSGGATKHYSNLASAVAAATTSGDTITVIKDGATASDALTLAAGVTFVAEHDTTLSGTLTVGANVAIKAAAEKTFKATGNTTINGGFTVGDATSTGTVEFGATTVDAEATATVNGGTLKFGTVTVNTGKHLILPSGTVYTLGENTVVDGGYTGGIKLINSDAVVATVKTGDSTTSFSSVAAAVAAAKSRDTVTVTKETSDAITIPAGVTLKAAAGILKGTISSEDDEAPHPVEGEAYEYTCRFRLLPNDMTTDVTINNSEKWFAKTDNKEGGTHDTVLVSGETLKVEGGASLAIKTKLGLAVQDGGNGTVVIDGANTKVTITTGAYIGDKDGGETPSTTGKVTVSGGASLEVQKEIWVGNHKGGNGTLEISGASSVTNISATSNSTTKDGIRIGCDEGSVGSIVVKDTATLGSSTWLTVGQKGTGTLDVQDSAVVTAPEFYVGAESTGTLKVGGSAKVTAANGIIIGQSQGGNGTIEVTGGELKSAADVRAQAGTSTINVSGGTFSIGDEQTEKWLYLKNCTVNLNGGTLALGAMKNDGGTDAVNFNGGTLKALKSSTNADGKLVPSGVTAVIKEKGAVVEVVENVNAEIAANLTAADGVSKPSFTKKGAGALVITGTIPEKFVVTVEENGGTVTLPANSKFVYGENTVLKETTADGNFVLEHGTVVAKVGDTSYAKVADALNAAGDNGSVTVVADSDETVSLKATQTLTVASGVEITQLKVNPATGEYTSPVKKGDDGKFVLENAVTHYYLASANGAWRTIADWKYGKGAAYGDNGGTTGTVEAATRYPQAGDWAEVSGAVLTYGATDAKINVTDKESVGYLVIGDKTTDGTTITASGENGVAVAETLAVGFSYKTDSDSEATDYAGKLTLDGGTYSAKKVELGYTSTASGKLTVKSGTKLTTTGDIEIAHADGSTGTMVVETGAEVVAGGLVGIAHGKQSANGSLTVNGGKLNANGKLDLSNSPYSILIGVNSKGEMKVTSGEVTVANNVAIGNSEEGTLTVSGGKFSVGKDGDSVHGIKFSLFADNTTSTLNVTDEGKLYTFNFTKGTKTGSAGKINLNGGTLGRYSTSENNTFIEASGVSVVLREKGGTFDIQGENAKTAVVAADVAYANDVTAATITKTGAGTLQFTGSIPSGLTITVKENGGAVKVKTGSGYVCGDNTVVQSSADGYDTLVYAATVTLTVPTVDHATATVKVGETVQSDGTEAADGKTTTYSVAWGSAVSVEWALSDSTAWKFEDNTKATWSVEKMTKDETATAPTVVANQTTFTVPEVEGTTVKVTVGDEELELKDGKYTATIGDTVTIVYTATSGKVFSDSTLSKQVTWTAKADENPNAPNDTASDAVAKIGETLYATVTAALEKATEGQTVTVVTDYTNASGEAAVFGNTAANITLDLNGKTITGTDGIRLNAGTLTITDSSEGKAGKVVATDAKGVALWARQGSAVVKAGTFENMSTEEATVYVGYGDATVTTYENQTVTIEGGTFTNKGEYKYGGSDFVHCALNVVNKDAFPVTAIVVKGGTFSTDPAKGDDNRGGTFVADGYISVAEEGGVFMVYEAVTVTFTSEHGNAPDLQKIKKGGTATNPGDLTAEGYTFGGWLKDNETFDFSTALNENTTLTAKWTLKTYTITWSVDGKTTDTTVNHGDTPVFSGSTDKAATAEYTYTFTGWSPTIEAATKDVTYTAVYSQTKNQYKVTIPDVTGAKATVKVNGEAVTGVTEDGKTVYTLDYGTVATVVWERVGEYVVTGGTDGFTVGGEITFGEGNYTLPTATVAVAQVGDEYFTTLKDAIASACVATASSPSQVTLLKDIPLTETIVTTAGYTLNLNGKNVTATNCRAFWVKSGTVEITGTGTITAKADEKNDAKAFPDSSSVIRVGDGVANEAAAKLTIASGVTVSTAYCYGVTVFGKNTVAGASDPAIELSVAGTVSVTGSASAISGNGSEGLSATKITIGATAKVSAASDAAIYHPGSGTLTISGGEIAGPTGVYVKGGTVNVTGGTIKGTGDKKDFTHNGDGLVATGDAFVIENCGYPAGEPTVSITGGTFESTNAKAVASYAYSTEDTERTAVGGFIRNEGDSQPTFNTAVEPEYCASGFIPKTLESGKYGVEAGWKVTFKSEDGTKELQVVYVAKGQTPAFPEDAEKPTKERTAQHTYTFAGWATTPNADTKLDSLPAVDDAEATYYAVFTATVNEYTITWQNEDGSTIDTTKVAYGATPTHADPTKDRTDEFTFTFAGWSPEVLAVTGDATYKATFNSTVNKYALTVAELGHASVQSVTVDGKTVDVEQDGTYLIEYGKTAVVTWVAASGYMAGDAVGGTVSQRFEVKSATTATYSGETKITQAPCRIDQTYYATLASAVANATDGQTVTLVTDVELTVRVDPDVGEGKALAIDLGGKKITRTGTSGNGSAFDVKSGAVTIKNGTIDCTQDDTDIAADGVYAITSRSGSTVTLEGLDITVNSECGACVYPFAGSRLTIKSGTYKNTTTTPYRYNTSMTGMAVNQPNVDTQYLFIEGGTFSQVDPFEGDDSGKLESFLQTGYITYKTDGGYGVKKGQVVKFLDEDETELAKIQVAEGETPAYPETAKEPTKAATVQYTYTFKGWKAEGGTEYTGELPAAVSGAAVTYTAVYTETVNKYSVTTVEEFGEDYGSVKIVATIENADAEYTLKYGDTEYKGEKNADGKVEFTVSATDGKRFEAYDKLEYSITAKVGETAITLAGDNNSSALVADRTQWVQADKAHTTAETMGGTWSVEPVYSDGGVAELADATFTATTASGGDIVTLEFETAFTDINTDTLASNPQAAVRIGKSGAFEVFTAGEWKTAAGVDSLDVEKEYKVVIRIDYTGTGSYSVSIDGTALTVDGAETYALGRSEAKSVGSVRLEGAAKFRSMVGEYFEGNMAQVGDKRYATVADAVKAAEAADEVADIALLHGTGKTATDWTVSGGKITWDGTVTVNVDGNITVPKTWVEAHLTEAKGVAAKRTAVLQSTGANGLSYLASYALGLEPTDATAVPKLALESVTDDGKLKVKLVCGTMADNVSVTVVPQRKAADGDDWTAVANSSFAADATAEIDPAVVAGGDTAGELRFDISIKAKGE